MRFFDFLRGERPSLIQRALSDLQIMLETSRRMFEDACAHLLENEILEGDLNAQDETVNDREADIRRAVLEHMKGDPKREVVLGLVLISIVQDAERIGDLAKSISEVARMAHGPRHGTQIDRLRALRDRVAVDFRDTSDALTRADEERARAVMDRSAAIKEELTGYIREIARDGSLDSNTAVVMALGARMMSRTSSHLSNIASSVAMPFEQIRRQPDWE